LLAPIISLPKELQEGEVEVIILPCSAESEGAASLITFAQSDKSKTQKSLLNASALSQLREVVANGLENAVNRGETFGFNVQKLLDKNESKADRAYRLQQEKSAWANSVIKRAKKGKYKSSVKAKAH
jgi:hypothetical protein